MSAPLRDQWDQYKAEILSRLDIPAVFKDIKGQKSSGTECILGLCPFHDDHNQSFGVNTKTGTWECFAGCDKGDVFAFLVRSTGKQFKEVLLDLGDQLGLPRPVARECSTSARINYDYLDETGTLLYRVVRGPGKKFWQQRPDGNGGWVKNLQDVRRVLYRLPELIARPDETVYVVEGEKDADRLHAAGLLATTNSGGAGKWKPSHSESLQGRSVVIIPDNDKVGLEHAVQVARDLQGIASSVKIVELPNSPLKGDVSDWLDAGHTIAELQELVEQAAAEGPGSEGNPAGQRPVIIINGRQLREVIEETWRCLLAQNDPPQLFVSSGQLARLVIESGGHNIQLLNEDTAFGVLLRAADWAQRRGKSTIDAKPPKDIARDILANPHSDLPKLDAVMSTPVFDATGHLVCEPGYHRDGRLWLHLDDSFIIAAVPDRPSDDERRLALGLIQNHLFCDFPFAAKSDKAHALAALLLPFVRRMIAGPTPIYLIEAPTPGSGKSLLADLISIIATGRSSEATTVTKNEDESRKKLTSILSRGRPIVVIDNIQGGLESAQLSSAITAEIWSDRILGKTQMVEFPNRALWMVTGNNPKLTMEIARRCVRIRLEPAVERPWERKDFKHHPIRVWAHGCRHGLVWAVLVIVQAWIADGRKPGSKTLGSFEDWVAVIGGILQHAGVDGFLEGTDEFYEAADTDTGEWKAFVNAWRERYATAPVTPTDLMSLAEAGRYVPFALTGNSEPARLAKFGKALGGLRDRKFGDYQIVATPNKRRGSNDYRLVPVAGELFTAAGGE
jgi:hypothetical protein